jgi:hypothetical protein
MEHELVEDIINEVAEESKLLTHEELVEMFDEGLEEMGSVKIGGYTFSPARVLKELDSVAYLCELADYADTLMSNGWKVEGY